MLLYILVLIQFIFVQTIKYQKPIAEKVWSVRCKKNENVLNDCNWCWCGPNYHFQCKARVCEEVDPFGHFKDTIQEVDVGMEGHGSWRSRPTACTPGVQYQRGTIHCICDEDGNWPNPVCRDLFRILHSIEVTESKMDSLSQTCSPTKLYLVGCNACFCPSSGQLDAKLCTNRSCSEGDPVLEIKTDNLAKDFRADPNTTDAGLINFNVEFNLTTQSEIVIPKEKKEVEIYALCSPHKFYKIGNQNCECLANNRILCKEYENNVTRETGHEQDLTRKSKRSICSGKVGSVIKVECNLCKCTSNDYMYCTTKKCLNMDKKLVYRKVRNSGKPVKAPLDDVDCVPGTSYQRGCNQCYCKKEKGQKIFSCTIRACENRSLYDMARDCVSDTSYETDCYICTCDIINRVKHQVCKINPKCMKSLAFKEKRSDSLDSLHGYCEPLHVYKKGCNTCRCLSNGKIVKCTTRTCVTRSSESVEVEIVPLQQAVSEPCPPGHSYKVGCNLCFCLSNGNALCTTADCSKQIDILHYG